MRTPTALPRSLRRALAALLDERASESGVSLIEVVISALLVAVIVVGTLSGFDTAGRAVGDQRQRNQATLLASQDQERLRGMNVTELGRYGSNTYALNESGGEYKTGEQGTKYTVESKARFVSAAKEAFSCETESSADYIQTSSQVTWPALGSGASKREAVSQSSIVPVPSSNSLLVNVVNQLNEPIEGATVKVTGKTSGGKYEQLTPESGCVIFGALADTEVTIVAAKSGWINQELETEPSQEAQLSTTSLVKKEFALASGGSLKAEFESNGVTSGVQGDTVYIAHTSTPEKVVGTAGTYVSSLTASPLYPFQTPGTPPGESRYTVFAGECSSSDPVKVNTALKDPIVQINPGSVTTAKLEVPQIKTEVWEGSSSTAKGAADSKAEVKLTDACGTSRVMKTSSGLLERPYQPYGKTKLCASQTIGSSKYKYSTEFTVTAKTGYTVPAIYMSASANKITSGGC
ncbi:MAG TPA: hypothetical protein VL988_01455 [Solirubrobacteraceae bacterium]|nr:hypothetical protein [Solirubrobacteraceae bacterium]